MEPPYGMINADWFTLGQLVTAVPRATCSGVDIWAAGTSTWIFPSLKENWAVWDPQRAAPEPFQNSILSPFLPPTLFSLFICCVMRSPEGFVPGEERQHIYIPVTHVLRVREGAYPSPHQPGCSPLHLG